MFVDPDATGYFVFPVVFFIIFCLKYVEVQYIYVEPYRILRINIRDQDREMIFRRPILLRPNPMTEMFYEL